MCLITRIYTQEVELFEAAWDGNVKGVECALEAGVQVDSTKPVSIITV